MKRILFALFLSFTATSFAQIAPPGVQATDTAPNPNGGLAAISKLPAKYRKGVLKLSADNGKPNPKKWNIVAQDGNNPARNFVVSYGQISAESSGIFQNIRSVAAGTSHIRVNKVKVDNMGAWHAAQNYASSKGANLGSVSYSLQQNGKNATPIWYVWCYTHGGSYLGYIQLLATDGKVIFRE